MKQLREYIDNYFRTNDLEYRQAIQELIKELTAHDLGHNQELFDALVPISGKADTIAGEILRAINKIGYRYYNDGDYYFEGYGIETAGSSALYLINHTNQIIAKLIRDTIPINHIASSPSFEHSLNSLLSVVAMYLRANPQLFITRNIVDSTEDYTKQAGELFYEYDQMINGEEDF